MFNPISTTKSFSNLSASRSFSSYEHVDDDPHSFGDNQDEHDHDDGDFDYDEYDQEVDPNEDANDDDDDEDELDEIIDDVEYGEEVDAEGDISIAGNAGRVVPSKIIEPPEFILSLSNLMENSHTVLEPFEDDDEEDDGANAPQNEQGPIGRHILSDTQRRLHLQRLSARIISSLSNCSAGLNNERIDDALSLTTLMLPLYFPQPMDQSAIDFKSDASLLRELSPPRPAPLVLVRWLDDHDRQPDQNSYLNVLQYLPNSALHYDFWPILQKLALRCKLEDLTHLIASPTWDIADGSQPGARVYTRAAAYNLQRASKIVQDIVAQSPAIRYTTGPKNAHKISRAAVIDDEGWDTSSLPWRMWRSKIARAIDEILRISQSEPGTAKPNIPEPQNDATRLFRSKPTVASNSEASLIPHEIARELRIILQIFLGDKETILKTSDNWLEAVVGLAAYYDETGASGDGMEWDKFGRPGIGSRASNAYREDPLKKIAKCFHHVNEVFPLPALRNLQSATGDVLAGRVPKALKFLAKRSLPVASAAAELFAWGGYFPTDLGGKASTVTFLTSSVLGLLDQEGDKENAKEKIISDYALALASLGVLHDAPDLVEGWEVGLAALRRTVTPATRHAASKLIRLVELDVNNPARVERLVETCARHGLVEEQKYVSESFAQKLLAAGQIGSSLLYFSRAGCNSRIHNVMSRYVANSLRAGQPIPPERDLDDTFRELLTSPMALAKPEEDVLRREIAGFAALRSFYESMNARRYEDAAMTLVVLTQSAGEKIDGGMLHEAWESVLVPDNLAGLVYELLHGYGEDSKMLYEYLGNNEVFTVLSVMEALFLVGGQTLEAVQEEFAQILESREASSGLDFVEAVTALRTILARTVATNWLKEESAKHLVF
ncbi:hypothetical protein Dda_0504 [Drechslerella dactyloides]|uniref:Nuclear pore complex protein Nup85 n=1 Tax=Drechslerella dactyloides TaxID=74499 RepID=A0AAD6J4Q6_DREDA|nr:hypothetical protein Dda_0504 [Drechslerella dactyloides]